MANSIIPLLLLIPLKLSIPTIQSLPGTQPNDTVEIRQGGEIFSSVSEASLGSIRSRHAQLLELFRIEQMDMDLRMSADESSRQCALQVILYGDKDLSDSLKEVLRGQELFLQDPYGASRDVLYWNPQKYCNPPGTRTSHFHPPKPSQEMVVEEVSHVDSLAAFTSKHDMPKTEPSSLVRTSLEPQVYSDQYSYHIAKDLIGTRNKHYHS